MNADQITKYIQFAVGHLLVSLCQPKVFNITNIFNGRN